MSHPLSKKQLEVLRALEQFARTRGHIPSVRELATRLKKSPTTVFQHLKALERRGYLKGDGSAHGWKLLQASDPRPLVAIGGGLAAELALEREAESAPAPAPVAASVRPDAETLVDHEESEVPEGWVRVRIAGTIAAGAPIEAVADSYESRVFPADMVPRDAFALRVRGSSMIDDHICDGDLVVVRPQQQVRDGEIAVALLDDGSATLKRVFREQGRVRLQPANATMEPIYVDDVTIQGRVVGVWRRCE
ncbi:MAG: repressor LexA [Planctomycetes bacterium]|nr:repressor LexA [Planctomycetota bacterium]